MEQDEPSHFRDPLVVATSEVHHDDAAELNRRVADEASLELDDMLSGTSPMKRMLLKAAAGAGKSFALKRLVVESTQHTRGQRVAITAFTNKQVRPLAISLGESLGRNAVALLAPSRSIPSNIRRRSALLSARPRSDLPLEPDALRVRLLVPFVGAALSCLLRDWCAF